MFLKLCVINFSQCSLRIEKRTFCGSTRSLSHTSEHMFASQQADFVPDTTERQVNPKNYKHHKNGSKQESLFYVKNCDASAESQEVCFLEQRSELIVGPSKPSSELKFTTEVSDQSQMSHGSTRSPAKKGGVVDISWIAVSNCLARANVCAFRGSYRNHAFRVIGTCRCFWL